MEVYNVTEERSLLNDSRDILNNTVADVESFVNANEKTEKHGKLKIKMQCFEFLMAFSAMLIYYESK